MADLKDYLEGNYDGENITEQVFQVVQDAAEAAKIAKEVEKLYEEYIQEGDSERYLIDGAVLWCNQATTAPFEMPDGTRIHLKFKGTELNVKNGRERGRERKYTKLHVPDGKMLNGELLNATILDCEQGKNIYPFKCNCKLAADREKELDAIYEYLNRSGRGKDVYSEGGVCQFLMRLDDRWVNMLRDTEDFNEERENNSNLEPEGGGAKKFSEKAPCLTMQSMLFCRHGGLIRPVESGQFWEETGIKKSERAIKRVSDQLIELLKDYETGKEKNADGKWVFLPRKQPALKPYPDSKGVMTWGWGHAIQSKEDKMVMLNGEKVNLDEIKSIKYSQAEEILAQDICKYENKLTGILEVYCIEDKVTQCFYDALFLFGYNLGMECLRDKHWSEFLNPSNFDLGEIEEIKLLFGDYTDHLNVPIMCRRLDEIDVAIKGTYTREFEIQRYGDIFTKKSNPNSRHNLKEMEDRAREAKEI